MMCGMSSAPAVAGRHMENFHPAMKKLIISTGDKPGKYFIQPGSSTKPFRPLALNW